METDPLDMATDDCINPSAPSHGVLYPSGSCRGDSDMICDDGMNGDRINGDGTNLSSSNSSCMETDPLDMATDDCINPSAPSHGVLYPSGSCRGDSDMNCDDGMNGDQMNGDGMNDERSFIGHPDVAIHPMVSAPSHGVLYPSGSRLVSVSKKRSVQHVVDQALLHHSPSIVPKRSKPSSSLLPVGCIDSSNTSYSDDMSALSSSSVVECHGVRSGTLVDFGLDGNGEFSQYGKFVFNCQRVELFVVIYLQISFHPNQTLFFKNLIN